MKCLYFDCFAGISGDMTLGALIDIGADVSEIRNGLSRLNVDGWLLTLNRELRCGISGTRAQVTLNSDSHNNYNQQHFSPGDHPDFHVHAPHPSRSLKDIESLILRASLPPKVADMSLKIFRNLAEAEAKIHNKASEEIHFHEIGAIDSIVDIIGTVLALNSLDFEEVWSSPVEVGGGMMHCGHGLMPIPAPATAELLCSIPITSGSVNHEATTPTGAAILANIVSCFPKQLNGRILQTGYGIGGRVLADFPNVLRVYMVEVESA